MGAPKDPIKRAEWIAKLQVTHLGKKYTPMSKQSKVNISVGLKKYYQEYPNTAKEQHNTPEAIAIHSAANLKAQNTPEILELIQQYGSPLIDRLRSKYYSLNFRCNNSNYNGYENYGGRGIQNLFPSPSAFVVYVINELHITELSQIDGLQIDRIDNNSHYMPGNIHFVTHKENQNNKRSSKKDYKTPV